MWHYADQCYCESLNVNEYEKEYFLLCSLAGIGKLLRPTGGERFG